jgi:hypothetical protein
MSIRTVVPRRGARVCYDDQRRVHQQIFAGGEELDYAFMGTDPAAPDNVWLRKAAERQILLIYFLGVSPWALSGNHTHLRRRLGCPRAARTRRFRRAGGRHRRGQSTGRARATLRSSPGQTETAPGILPRCSARRL